MRQKGKKTGNNERKRCKVMIENGKEVAKRRYTNENDETQRNGVKKGCLSKSINKTRIKISNKK